MGARHEAETRPQADPALAAHLTELLQRRLREAIGAERFNAHGRLIDWRSGLVEGVEPGPSARRLQAMGMRLARPDGAMTLVLNSFLPWQDRLDGLRLAGADGFAELFFATRCPTGARGTPPSVDLVLLGPQQVIAGAARVFDYLAPRRPELSDAYRNLEAPAGMQAWLELMRDAASFRHVDVVGLAKLAIGLCRIFVDRRVRLLYLFLEPRQAEAPIFAAHRAEIARMAGLVADSAVGLAASSLHELWESWCRQDTPPKVRAIAAELARRYGVAMPSRAPL